MVMLPILSVLTLSAHAQLQYQQFHKIKQSTQKPHGDGFSVSFVLVSLFFLLVCFCLYFATLHFVKQKEKM